MGKEKEKKKKGKVDKAEQGRRQTTVTHKFTALFPAIFEKAEFDDGKEEYGVTMLFPKNVDLDKPAKGEKYSLKEIVHNAAVAKWGEDEDDWPEDLYMPFRDGDTDKNKKSDPTYKGKIFVRAKNGNRRPGCVDANLDPITDPDEIYPGVVCRAQVYAFAYQKSGNVGVSLILHNIQKVADGEHIGGVFQAPADAFASAGDDDDDDEDQPRSKKTKSLPSKKSKARDEDEDEDEDDDDEDDEDDEPKPKKKSSKPAPKKKPKDEDEDDGDDDLIDDDEDEDDSPPPPKKKKK